MPLTPNRGKPTEASVSPDTLMELREGLVTSEYGGIPECLYCGADAVREAEIEHEEDCPVGHIEAAVAAAYGWRSYHERD